MWNSRNSILVFCTPNAFVQEFNVLSSDEEIEDVPPIRGLSAIELGVTALAAGHSDKLFVLNVKNFCKIPSSGLKLIAVILVAPTLWADVLLLLHRRFSFVMRQTAGHDRQPPERYCCWFSSISCFAVDTLDLLCCPHFTTFSNGVHDNFVICQILI